MKFVKLLEGELLIFLGNLAAEDFKVYSDAVFCWPFDLTTFIFRRLLFTLKSLSRDGIIG
jgi:hypothetical protein